MDNKSDNELLTVLRSFGLLVNYNPNQVRDLEQLRKYRRLLQWHKVQILNSLQREMAATSKPQP